MARVLGILRGLKRGQHTNKHKKIKNLGLTNRKMYFSIGIYSFPMDPMDSIGTIFYPLIQHRVEFYSLTNRRNELFHWNLFVSNGSPTLHHYTSGFPMESKGIRLESSQRVLDTIRKFEKEEALQKVGKRNQSLVCSMFILSP